MAQRRENGCPVRSQGGRPGLSRASLLHCSSPATSGCSGVRDPLHWVGSPGAGPRQAHPGAWGRSRSWEGKEVDRALLLLLASFSSSLSTLVKVHPHPPALHSAYLTLHSVGRISFVLSLPAGNGSSPQASILMLYSLQCLEQCLAPSRCSINN